jgi:uncharacterized membrane protein YvlD (DUF360 family)
MAQNTGSGNGDHLSLQTLVIAAAASATAAILTSHLWKDGTVIAAAMTPVIVSIVKEMLAKPMDSELVKKPVQQVSRIASGRRASQVVEEEAADPATGDVVLSHPRRTYGRAAPRRRLHLKVAVVTGLLAFVIAALVLTVPELLFGGAVSSSGGSTTIFGGSGSKSKREKARGESKPGKEQPAPSRTTPATPPPSDSGDTKEPTTTTPAPTSTTPAPTQTTPAPAPTTPSAPEPPSP